MNVETVPQTVSIRLTFIHKKPRYQKLRGAIGGGAPSASPGSAMNLAIDCHALLSARPAVYHPICRVSLPFGRYQIILAKARECEQLVQSRQPCPDRESNLRPY